MKAIDRYGPDDAQSGSWQAVDSGSDRLPTVMLIHGGFWRSGYDRSLEDDVASDLAERGYLVWNVDYRSAEHPWPTTLRDIAAAFDRLWDGQLSPRVDHDRVAVAGHSAGGHLALWLAGRGTSPSTDGAPGGRRPALAVSQAGVAALTLAAEQNLGAGAAQALCGGTPTTVPDRYREADPLQRLPTATRTVLIHSADDDRVPISQSEAYLSAAVAAGDDCTLRRVDGDHFAHLRPDSDAVARLRDALATM